MQNAHKSEKHRHGIGTSMPRIEDDAFLRGTGCFIDDVNLNGQLYACFLRSPHANAHVKSIDVELAMSCQDVVAVYTMDDLAADNVGSLQSGSSLTSRDGTEIRNPEQLALVNHVRYVGDSVAVVIARSLTAAQEAALAVQIDYAVEKSVVDPLIAVKDHSPRVWDEYDSNVALDWWSGESEAVDGIFDQAHHVARTTVTNNRIVVAAIEPRGALASFDTSNDRLTLWTPTQGGSAIQSALVRAGAAEAASQIRVITPDVGGGFGIKNGIYPEQIVVAWAARKLRCAVKWYADRSDAFQTDYHARDHIMSAELALDSAGNFLAIRCDVVSNMGAYLTDAGPVIPTLGGTRMLANVYKIPAAHARSRCVFTNTAPIAAFRGAGKPEFAHLVESVVDQAAKDLQLDRNELRRRNIITHEDLPWRTPTGLEYDSGDFLSHLNYATDRYDENDLRKRRQQSLNNGKLLGIGFSVYTEPDGYKDNRVEMSFDPDGYLTVITSAQTNGQGQATAYTQIAESLLGIGPSKINIVEGDTDRTGFASGSGGSRSATVTGAAMHFAAEELIDKGRKIAAHVMETNAEDIEFADGNFSVTGTDLHQSWKNIAALAHQPGKLPDNIKLGLEATHHYDAPVYCYPCGCHVCELEVDIDTGVTKIIAYFSFSDFGTVINPMMVEGQLHGGIAQGIGQVLMERTVYDDDSGQLFSGSFMDYCIPKAMDMPNFDTNFSNSRCLTNPLGIKGCGESGPTASLPAVSSALFDALQDYNCDELRMPFTAQRVWQVLRHGVKPTDSSSTVD